MKAFLSRTILSRGARRTSFSRGLVLFLCLFGLLGQGLYSRNLQKVIEISSPVYQLLDNIYLELGLAHTTKAKPWTEEELLFLLSRVDRGALSAAGKKAYDYIEETVNPRGRMYSEKNFEFDMTVELSPEAYYHIPLDGSGDTTILEQYYYFVGSQGQNAEVEYDWQHDYDSRKAFLDVPLEFWFFNSLYMTTSITAKEEHLATYVEGNYFNILLDHAETPPIDLYFPFQALVSLGGTNWNLLFGRDKLSWGNGTSGNLMLSDYSDFYDFIQFKAYWRNFTITNVYTVMDRFLYDGTDVNYKAFLGRRLDFRILERVMLSVSESVTFANKQPELIRDLNFLMIFHNWMIPERSNSLLAVELSVNPWKYINIYGQIAMDEFAVKYEEDRGGGGGPPVFGYLAGITGTIPAGPGYVTLAGEWVLTSPWLYNRKNPPYYDNVRRYWSLVEDIYGNEYKWPFSSKPIGYEYGPDCIVWYGQGRYIIPGGLSAIAEITYLTRGENTIISAWDPQKGDLPPTGEFPEKSFILRLGAEYPVFSWMTLGGNVYYTSVVNKNHVEGSFSKDMELTCFVAFKVF